MAELIIGFVIGVGGRWIGCRSTYFREETSEAEFRVDTQPQKLERYFGT